jgi:hypothetical protein
MSAKSYISVVGLSLIVLCQSSSMLGMQGDKNKPSAFTVNKKIFEQACKTVSRDQVYANPAMAVFAAVTIGKMVGVAKWHPALEVMYDSAQEASALETSLLFMTKMCSNNLSTGMDNLGQATATAGLTAVNVALRTEWGEKMCNRAGSALCELPGVERGYKYATSWVAPSTLGTIAKAGAVLFFAYFS